MCAHRGGVRLQQWGWPRMLALLCVSGAASAADAAAQIDVANPWIATGHVTATAQAPPQATGWQFEIAPYLWASGVKGTIGVLGQTADVDISFSEILENLDFALMFPAELRKGLWGIGGELIYLKVSKSAAVAQAPSTSIEFEESQLLLELSPRYRVLARRIWKVDALAGVRFMSLDPTLTIGPDVELGKRRSWADPIVGTRVIADLAPRWLVQARADIGGFGVGSDFTWQGVLFGRYRISDHVAVAAGYRYLDVDFEDTDDEFLYDVAMHGPVLGVVLTFGGPRQR